MSNFINSFNFKWFAVLEYLKENRKSLTEVTIYGNFLSIVTLRIEI